jgi:serine phosphatase RsbU (regulator of sigma subunit)
MAIVRTAARELVGADGATFVLRDRIGDAEFCHYADEEAIGPLWKGSRFPVSSCISGWAMINRRSVVIPDIYLDDRIPAELYKPTFVRGLAMVPIRASDPLGAIGTYWQNEHAPSTDELYILEALADVTAVSIELVRSYAGLERRVAERTAELNQRNIELMDNIAYAQRVQTAMLPPSWLIHGLLPQHFIIYRPKDLVSGDFYWIDDRNGLVFAAVADCTGHGVTGAFLSIMCTNVLNRIVNEFGITETGVMLDKARELVGEAFSKGQGMADGMDISLCAIDMRTKEVAWSGAHSDLWYVSGGRLMVLKAHNQPIGRTEVRTQFPTHRAQLTEGDMLYLMSDGFVDQFGGPKGKKFRSRQLQELLMRMHDRPLPEQRFLLEHAFDAWKGTLEQVDDVTFLGIRL